MVQRSAPAPFARQAKDITLDQFSDLGLAAPLLEALAAESYTTPTPIQAQAIPYVLAGRDLLGIAQTGTGKTAAFALPILHRLAAERRPPGPHGCRVLVLAPTRELASQIEESFATYGRNLRLTSTVVFGGVDMRRQQRIMARGVDILVATPGRLVDHLGQRSIRLDRVEVVVLDEVDRMLDIGFIHAIRRVMSHVPRQRQSLFFSATLPKDIAALAAELLQGPGHGQRRARSPPRSSASSSAWSTSTRRRRRPCWPSSWASPAVTRAIVFTRTKHRADQVTRHLQAAGVDGGGDPRQQVAEQPRARARPASRTARPRCWSRPTSPRAASTSTPSATSSTSTCPTCPRPMSTASAAPPAPARRAWRSRFCSADESGNWRAIETLIRQRVPVLQVEGNRSTAPRPPAAERRRATSAASAPARRPRRPRRRAATSGAHPSATAPGRRTAGQPAVRLRSRGGRQQAGR